MSHQIPSNPRATDPALMIGDIIKNGAISFAVAIVLAFAISYFLELSPEGIKNITFISVIMCLGLGQLIRLVRRKE
jgi:hypothetical protein